MPDRMFNPSVTRNSDIPTANSERYYGDPYEPPPPVTATMYVVMVSIEVSGFRVICGRIPAASTTAIVSPIARLTARMNEATTPESPAGSTTRVETSNFVAPRPYAASRRPRGTAESTSSLNEDTIGMIITPTTMQALSALNVSTRTP